MPVHGDLDSEAPGEEALHGSSPRVPEARGPPIGTGRCELQLAVLLILQIASDIDVNVNDPSWSAGTINGDSRCGAPTASTFRGASMASTL